MTNAAAISVKSVRFFERPVGLRTPFKFGAVTLSHARQVFVRVEAEVDGTVQRGMAAELLAAKWFDKNPDLTNDDNYDQLRQSLRLAAGLYIGAPVGTAFGLHRELLPEQHAACAREGLNGLIASFGPALLDRAIADAICRGAGRSIFDAVRANVFAVTAHTTPDLFDENLDEFLAARPLAETMAIRHTVGMADAITDAEIGSPVGDGLPESLEQVVARYGHRHFKLKVGGDMAADIDRLCRIASVLDRTGAEYRISLDGNEQYENAEAVRALVAGIDAEPLLARLWASTRYIEQPIARTVALSEPVHALQAAKPIVIDESDSDIGVFPIARGLGYRGISSKSCKGFYRSLLNRARADKWNRECGCARFFITGEDLTTQPGIAVQQDFALAALVGLGDVERNAQHYVDGFGDAPGDEQQRYHDAHRDLYSSEDGRVRLNITDGLVSLRSIGRAAGFGVACEPDWASMTEMPGRP